MYSSESGTTSFVSWDGGRSWAPTCTTGSRIRIYVTKATSGTDGYVTCTTITTAYTEPRRTVLRAPFVWGWWAAFYPVPAVLVPDFAEFATRPTRKQARQCAGDVRRWKRRRFLHKLRAEAA